MLFANAGIGGFRVFTIQKGFATTSGWRNRHPERLDCFRQRGPWLWCVQRHKGCCAVVCRTWTSELKDRKIRVHVVSPWPNNTPAITLITGNDVAAEEAFKTQMAAGVPLGRLGEADEIAEAVVFLASDDSSYIADEELFVDGGFVEV